jgi:hypothetical protein
MQVSSFPKSTIDFFVSDCNDIWVYSILFLKYWHDSRMVLPLCEQVIESFDMGKKLHFPYFGENEIISCPCLLYFADYVVDCFIHLFAIFGFFKSIAALRAASARVRFTPVFRTRPGLVK